MSKYDGFKFIHIRNFEPSQCSLPQCDGFYQDMVMHPYGGYTVAYRREPDGVVEVRVARCSMKDRYVKQVGRETAVNAEGVLLMRYDERKPLFKQVMNAVFEWGLVKQMIVYPKRSHSL